MYKPVQKPELRFSQSKGSASIAVPAVTLLDGLGCLRPQLHAFTDREQPQLRLWCCVLSKLSEKGDCSWSYLWIFKVGCTRGVPQQI